MMLKKILSGITFCIIGSGLHAQDVLMKTNGDELEIKTLEISDSQLKYKKWDNLEGPTYTLDLSEVFMIKYPNGSKDVFKKDTSKQQTEAVNTANSPIEKAAVPSANNDFLIESYNTAKTVRYEKSKNKNASRCFYTIGVTPSSVLSTDELTVELYQSASINDENATPGNVVVLRTNRMGKLTLGIRLVNNTDRNLYIDKASCFRINANKDYQSYYSNTQSTVSQGGGVGGGINAGAVTGLLGVGGAVGNLAGGINVGGGTNNGVSTSYADERVIVIPPHGKYVLADGGLVLLHEGFAKNKYLVKNLPERAALPYNYKVGIKQHEYRDFTEEQFELMKYIVSYSTTPNFETIIKMEFGIFPKEIVGLGITGYCFKDCDAIVIQDTSM